AVTRERAIGVKTKSITLLAQENETIFNTQVTIRWIAEENNPKTKYYVIVSNFDNEQVAWYETEQTHLQIDFANLKRAKNGEANFIVSVVNAQNPEYKGVFNIALLDKDQKDKIQKEIGDFKPENALDYMVLAKFFEEKKLNLDALACYEKVLALQNSENYRTAYMEFLVRNKMGYTYEGE
ncbi:MAG: hypothetical protein ACK40K_09575, partial [Raineya sp.]